MKLYYVSIDQGLEEDDCHHEEEVPFCWGYTLDSVRHWLDSMPATDGSTAEILELDEPTDKVTLVRLLNGSHEVEGERLLSFEARDEKWVDVTPTEQADRDPHEGLFISIRSDLFLCSKCIPAGTDMEGVVVWEEESGGWISPVICHGCRRSIPVYVGGEPANEVDLFDVTGAPQSIKGHFCNGKCGMLHVDDELFAPDPKLDTVKLAGWRRTTKRSETIFTRKDVPS